MKKQFDREAAVAAIAELAELEELTDEQRAALAYAHTLASFAVEGVKVETVGGEQTVLVDLVTGYVRTDEKGNDEHFDQVRLRQPRIVDEWRRDALATEINGGTEPARGSVLFDLCLVAQCVVDWPGVPQPTVREHLATLNRYDAGRLITSLYALEDHCERQAIAGKSERRSSS